MAPGRQTTDCVLLIRPQHFAVNKQTAATNRFQSAVPMDAALAARAADEVDAVAARLEQAGVTPFVFDDTLEPAKPDAVFPNNWVSFHSDGRVVLYPMQAENRRAERRRELLDALAERGFVIDEVIDLTGLEQRGDALEGTGSLVLDRPRRAAYATLSSRTTRAALAAFAQRTGYRVHAFHSEFQGAPVYHTNVLLVLGRHFAVVCDLAVPDAVERDALLRELAASGREVIRIEPAQLGEYAANLLELDAADGPLIAMSTRAHEALLPAQRRALAAHGELMAIPLPAVEAGGGSLRCMLAEIFLPRRDRAGG